jgi:hypothetical protein
MKQALKIINAIIQYIILPIVIAVSGFQFFLMLFVFCVKSPSSNILSSVLVYLCVLAISIYCFIKMSRMSRVDEVKAYKKSLAVLLSIIGITAVGFGLLMIGIIIYNDVLKGTEGVASYVARGIYLGLVAIGIGLIPLSAGVVLWLNANRK